MINKIFILRHADALDTIRAKVNSDRERPLSPKGIQDMEISSQGMKNLGLNFTGIYHSELLRAYETAMFVAREFSMEKSLVKTSLLNPEGDPVKLASFLSKQNNDNGEILLVGHQPNLGELVSYLISQSTSSYIGLKKGSLTRIDIFSHTERGIAGELRWILTNKHLRSFA